MRSRRSPRRTMSPSFTGIWMIRPVMSALTSTLRLGTILPLAVTVATRFRRPTASSRTSTPFSRREATLKPTRPASASPIPPKTSSLFLPDIPIPQRKGRPTADSSAAIDLW